MRRRNFVKHSSLVGLALSMPLSSFFSGCTHPTEAATESSAFKSITFQLLQEWCDGMIRVQIMKPEDPTLHGLMKCPACETIHARLSDAVYPLLCLAKLTGEKKYLEAGIAAFEWADANVSLPDGSWTNDVNPKSWNGTTVFGAIALAETLKYHSDLLDEKRVSYWRIRLRKAAEFIYNKFPVIDATNVNYGATNIYALYLVGNLLNVPKYIHRSKALAKEIKNYFTYPNKLLFGEIKPSAHKLSDKGLPGVDLGYNVEESLNSIALYAVEENDKELLQLVEQSLATHLEFMLPDGGWDNSWGTRMFKWTYWGSRTCDGSQPAYSLLSGNNPAFATAALKNAELLQQCTAEGFLHGGPHYVSHGIKPCLHHTFTHAKTMAFIQDYWEHLPKNDGFAPLPRATADGIRYFEELDLALFARGDWRGTVSGYDAEYTPKKDLRQATGNALSLLYHNRVGLLCAASLAVYKQMEPLNQQEAPGKDIALTPRIEAYKDGVWYSNLFDLSATFITQDQNDKVVIKGKAQLKNEKRVLIDASAADFLQEYQCTSECMKLIVQASEVIHESTMFVLPIVSKAVEVVNQPDSNLITIQKPEGLIRITANSSITIRPTERGRTFNMVPGVEALPLEVYFDESTNKIEITIEVV